jgi:hypothetical protein
VHLHHYYNDTLTVFIVLVFEIAGIDHKVKPTEWIICQLFLDVVIVKCQQGIKIIGRLITAGLA